MSAVAFVAAAYLTALGAIGLYVVALARRRRSAHSAREAISRRRAAEVAQGDQGGIEPRDATQPPVR